MYASCSDDMMDIKGGMVDLKRVIVTNPYEVAYLEAVDLYKQHADQIRHNVLAGHHESCIAYGLWPLVEANGMDGPTSVLFSNATRAAIAHQPPSSGRERKLMVEYEIEVGEPFRYGSADLVSIGSSAFQTGKMTLHLIDGEEPEIEIELYVLVRDIPALIAALEEAGRRAAAWAAESQGE